MKAQEAFFLAQLVVDQAQQLLVLCLAVQGHVEQAVEATDLGVTGFVLELADRWASAMSLASSCGMDWRKASVSSIWRSSYVSTASSPISGATTAPLWHHVEQPLGFELAQRLMSASMRLTPNSVASACWRTAMPGVRRPSRIARASALRSRCAPVRWHLFVTQNTAQEFGFFDHASFCSNLDPIKLVMEAALVKATLEYRCSCCSVRWDMNCGANREATRQ